MIGSLPLTSIVPPLPSHWVILQSLGVCMDVTVPEGASAVPHTPMVQVREWQSVSVPGHGPAARHCTQAPAPLHSGPFMSLHGVFEPTGGLEGTPPVHTSCV